MSGHAQTDLLDPFTGHMVGIDNNLIPIIEALWALDIETIGSCEGHLGFNDAVICFAEPGYFEESDDGWSPVNDDDADEWDRWCAAVDAWQKTAPNGAKQVWNVLFGDDAENHAEDGWFRTATRDGWEFQLDGGGNSGSGLLGPTEDLPTLTAAVVAKVTAEDWRRLEVRRAVWRYREAALTA